MVRIESAGLSDVGQRRRTNEDALLRDDRLKLYLVADGMGGHKAGEVASNLATRIVSDTLINHTRQAGDSGLLAKELFRVLSASIQAANRLIFRLSQQNPDYQGMGTTLAAVLFANKTLIAANVGDSPIYLIRDGRTEALSTAHTFLAEYGAQLQAAGTQPIERYRHVITRSIGSRETVAADVHAVPCLPGDIVVLCSDGLSDALSPQEIAEVALRNSAGLTCRLLIDMANERGGEDNITVIVLKVQQVGPCAAFSKTVAAPAQAETALVDAFAPPIGAPTSPLPGAQPTESSPATNGVPPPSEIPHRASTASKEICVEFDADEFSTSTRALHFSTQGVLIETPYPLATGEQLTLTLSQLGTEAITMTVKAQVADRTDRRVMFRFLDISPDQREAIDALSRDSQA